MKPHPPCLTASCRHSYIFSYKWNVAHGHVLRVPHIRGTKDKNCSSPLGTSPYGDASGKKILILTLKLPGIGTHYCTLLVIQEIFEHFENAKFLVEIWVG